jgi:glutathione S-transferase
MALTLHFHPLASFCHKALIALYELDVGFEPVIVDLGDPASRAAFAEVWPLQKFPVLVDSARGATVAESTTVIEYLDSFYGRGRLVPHFPDLAWQVRLWDRVFDHYLHHPMQKIVGDSLRPEDARDPHGVAEARAGLEATYRFLAARLHPAPWAMGEAFTLADCAAAPALFYANLVAPFGRRDAKLHAYLGRLMAHPAFARVLAEAEPYFPMYPLEPKPSHRLAPL